MLKQALEFRVKLEYSTTCGRNSMTKKTKRLSWLFSLGIILLLAGCTGQQATPALEGELNMGIQITSTAFSEGGKIPRIYTCDDQNLSPPLSWTGVPTNTVSLALTMDDPDAPSGTWVHWVVYNLPPDITSLEQGKIGLGVEGKNDFNRSGYGGPCPPRGSNHRYYIKLYALDTKLDLKSGATKAQVENTMKGHILAQGQLMGRYNR
jgi:Raf kinase inhibitor-like YbhB/YbcL family protein